MIGDKVQNLPDGFGNSSKITHVTVPRSVTSIGEVFHSCSNMVSATLQWSLENYNSSAFYRFEGTLFLMDGTNTLKGTHMSPSAIFSLCETPPEVSDYSFVGSKEGVVVHVPSSQAMAEYKKAPYWNEFNYSADAFRPETFSIPAEQEALINTTFSITSNLGPWSESTPVAWASTDKTVATVDRTGKVTALGKGETDIVATCYDHVATCHLTVIDNVLKITPESITLDDGKTAKLTVTSGVPLNGVDLQWSCDDPAVATVTGNGTSATLLGIDRGVTTVHVTSAGFVEGSCQVEVVWRNKDSYARGDVNGDGMVDVGDISDEIDVILGKKSRDELRGDCALLLPRDVVDVSDLNELIYMVLGIGEPTLTETVGANGVSFKMVFVPGGKFVMGATDEQLPYINKSNCDEPAHQVTLSDFWISETEVTQELWEAVMGENPSTVIGARLPVDNVSRADCLEFIKRLNEITSMTFRLPTEAQWEYAARGGQWSHGFVYAGSDDPDEVAWYDVNSGGVQHQVATKAPNELGLYDMSGNLFEWCSDYYSGESYYVLPEKDPELTRPFADDLSGHGHVRRGGAFNTNDFYIRVSARSYQGWADGFTMGLRLVREL